MQPDLAVILLRVWAVGAEKSGALDALAGVHDELLHALAGLGAAPFTNDAERAALTYWSQPAETFAQRKRVGPGRSRPTGQIIAHLFTTLRLRDFTLLDTLEALVVEAANVRRRLVQWFVDRDNPEWRQVRAEAIRDAIGNGRDYAAALGGSLVSVDHLADVGLLGGDGGWRQRGLMPAVQLAGQGSPRRPGFHPQPIELEAVIEARLTASIAPV